MISVNLVSGCVSRDICQYLIDKNMACVLQYVGYPSIFSLMSGKRDITATPEHLNTVEISNFFKRGFCQDFNKTAFEYLFAKKSDYLIIGVSKAAHPILKKDDHILTRVALPNLFADEAVRKRFDFDSYELIKTHELDDGFLEKTVDKFCAVVLGQYRLNQIILHKYYEAEEFNDKGVLRPFSPERHADIVNGNKVLKKLYDLLEAKLKGCHVIEWPDNVISDSSHPWGLSPLHFYKDYYNYGEEMLRTIFKGLADEQEKAEQKAILDNYNYRLKLVHDNLQSSAKLRSANFTIQLYTNVINFFKELGFDNYGKNNFNKWLERIKSENKTVSVLKIGDSAGQILNAALKSYGIQTAFVTLKNDIKSLTESEWEECRKGNVIVSADVHSNAPLERDGIKAIRIAEIVKNG